MVLRSDRLNGVDLPNLIEEMGTLGRTEAAHLELAYRLIAIHQLTRMFQPQRAGGKGWTGTISLERIRAERILRQSPGLLGPRSSS